MKQHKCSWQTSITALKKIYNCRSYSWAARFNFQQTHRFFCSQPHPNQSR